MSAAMIATGLLDITAKRVSDSDYEGWFAKLLAAETKLTYTGSQLAGTRVVSSSPMSDETIALLADLLLGIPGGVKLSSSSWIQRNENFSDVLVVSFDAKCKHGLVVIEDRGVWAVSSAEYSWREVQDLDLCLGFGGAGELQLSALK